MPLYTLYLDPAAYGILAIVTAVNGVLCVVFTLGLTGAVTRFYFEYENDPATLAEFWGSILTFVMLLSALLGAVLLVIGDTLLRPLIGEVAFWPYVALGVVTTFFQPFFTTFLTVLQTRNQATRYSQISLAHFALMTTLTIVLVVVLRLGVTGALVATLVAAIVFFVVSLWLLRADFRVCLHWPHLRSALSYGLPQVPHSLAGQTTAVADRLILNSQLGAATAGLYYVGAMVSMVVEVVGQSVNRAYVPVSMRALKSREPPQLARLREMGCLIVAGACLLGAFVGVFGRELVLLLAASPFAGAAAVVPVLAFVGVANANYYLFVNALFFERSAIKLLPIGTLCAAILNVALALVLIPRYALIGAAASTLIAQTMTTILIAAIARRFDPVGWNYGRHALAFLCALACTLWLAGVEVGSMVGTIVVKLGGLAALALLLGFIFWRRPLILAVAIVRLARQRPDEAAALFAGTKVTP
jgi:O-antigen/teichoic acid export membrane protein